MSDVTVIDIGGTIAAHRRWFTFLGVALVIAGVLSIIFPLAGGLAVEIWAAIALLIAGGAQVAHAFAARQWQGFIIGLLIGVVYVVAGAMLWLNPIRGVVTLTAVLAAAIFISGLSEIFISLQIRPVGGWVWMMLSGILGVVVAIMIWQQLPSSAVWALGLLLGINLISSGFAFATLANSAQPMSGGSPSQRV